MSNPDKYLFDEDDVVVTHEKSHAAGVPAVLVSPRRSIEQMGAVRTVRTFVAHPVADCSSTPTTGWASRAH